MGATGPGTVPNLAMVLFPTWLLLDVSNLATA